MIDFPMLGINIVLFEDYFGELEDLKFELKEFEDEHIFYDQFEIIAKYKDGATKQEEKDKTSQDYN